MSGMNGISSAGNMASCGMHGMHGNTAKKEVSKPQHTPEEHQNMKTVKTPDSNLGKSIDFKV